MQKTPKESVQENNDERLKEIERRLDLLAAAAAPSVEDVEASSKIVLSPGKVYSIDTSQDNAVCYLSDFGTRRGEPCTIVNDGTNICFVIPPAGGNISGWESFPLLRKGAHASFVMTGEGKFSCIGQDQKMSWPRFFRDASDATFINTYARSSTLSFFAVRMNNGAILTADAGITVDLDETGIGGRVATENAATGFWHIYAVPSGDRTFGLIATQIGTPVTPEDPPGYPVNRYLWTVRVKSTGPVVIEAFYHSADGWYEILNRSDDENALVTVDGVQPTTNTWNQVDGTNLTGAGTTTNVFIRAPQTITDVVRLASCLATNSTSSQTGHVYLASGLKASVFGVTTYIGSRSVAVSTGSVAGYSASDQQSAEEVLPCSTGVCVSFQSFSQNYNYRLMLRGYRNSYWGID